VPGALAFVKAYEDALVAGDYEKAWSMLAPDGTAGWGSLAGYKTERQAYMASAGKNYTAVANPPGTLTLSEWLQGMDFAASVDLNDAVLVKVTWTALEHNNAGWEMWVVNPVPGGWALYEVR
jgi:hypothetical protein